MHESVDRGRSMARSKRIDDIFDLPARQVQRATTHRSLWAVRLPPPGRRVGRWKRRGDDVDESPDLGRFTDHSGRCPETVHEAAASRRRLGGRERPLPSSALRGLGTAIGPDKVAPTTLKAWIPATAERALLYTANAARSFKWSRPPSVVRQLRRRCLRPSSRFWSSTSAPPMVVLTHDTI